MDASSILSIDEFKRLAKYKWKCFTIVTGSTSLTIEFRKQYGKNIADL